jgi:hypothetical protein
VGSAAIGLRDGKTLVTAEGARLEAEVPKPVAPDRPESDHAPGGGGRQREPPPGSGQETSSNTLLAAGMSSLVLAAGRRLSHLPGFRRSTRVLNPLEHARETGTLTAMLSQGLGPIDDPALPACASEALPSVEYIALRER